MRKVYEFVSLRVERWHFLTLSVLLGIACLIVLVSGCTSKSPEKLVEEHCTGCHALTTIKVSQKTYEEWEVTVERMIDLGARLNNKQTQEVIDYLSNTYGPESP
jgi:hypothetical protein